MKETLEDQHRPGKSLNLAAVLFALALPSFVTLAYFVLAGDSAPRVQQVVYAVAKVLQFSFPIFWVAMIQKRKLRFKLGSTSGLTWGIAFGLIVSCIALWLYFNWVNTAEFFQGGRTEIEDKIAGIGIDQAWKFIALGVFYSLVHSLLEEYYWRWFVFDQFKELTRLWWAVLISSLGFMAHHVIVVGSYFGFLSVTTWVVSLLIAIGGAFWAWLYHSKESLLSPWTSHLLIDAAIFFVGFDIAQRFF